MGQAIGDILPFAAGVAVSVIAIIALIRIPVTPRAQQRNNANPMIVLVFGALLIGQGSTGLS